MIERPTAHRLGAIRRGRLDLHRRWMVRAYLVALAPVMFRVALYGAVGVGGVPWPGVIAALPWGSWAVRLLVHTLVLRAAAPRRTRLTMPASADRRGFRRDVA